MQCSSHQAVKYWSDDRPDVTTVSRLPLITVQATVLGRYILSAGFLALVATGRAELPLAAFSVANLLSATLLYRTLDGNTQELTYRPTLHG